MHLHPEVPIVDEALRALNLQVRFLAISFLGVLYPGMRAANVAVRFNDLADNEYAALRIGPNQSAAIDATCNWWGGASGPSSVGAGEGPNALVVQPGGATPEFEPVAVAPIASSATRCGP